MQCKFALGKNDEVHEKDKKKEGRGVECFTELYLLSFFDEMLLPKNRKNFCFARI